MIVKEAELALTSFSKVYHKKSTEDADSYLKKFLEKSIKDDNIAVKRGYT